MLLEVDQQTPTL